jgi:RNA polymerase primary sigma factor
MKYGTDHPVLNADVPSSGHFSIQLGHDRLLSAREERDLAVKIAHGDGEARDQLVRSNLRLVVTIARSFLNRGLEMEDLASEGNLGLLRAAVDFKPKFGTRFSTYAAVWIKQAIRHALANTTAMIRLPTHLLKLLSMWRKAEQNLVRELGRMPEFDQIASSLDLSGTQRSMIKHALRSRRLVPSVVDEDGRDFGPEADPEGRPVAMAERAETRQGLRSRMQERLDEREKTVIALRFGLEGGEPLTLKEVGQRLGFTREWIRKIEDRAMGKLGTDDDAPDERPRPLPPPSTDRGHRIPTPHPLGMAWHQTR